MPRLLDALIQLDNAARIGERVLGPRTSSGRALHDAINDLRRALAPAALHQLAVSYDPKADLMAILAAAEAAGMTWPDMADALNHYHAHPGRPHA